MLLGRKKMESTGRDFCYLRKKFLWSEGEEKGLQSKLALAFPPCGRSYPGPRFTLVREDVTVSCCLRNTTLKTVNTP